jgi:trimeric autotransporter adhesin
MRKLTHLFLFLLSITSFTGYSQCSLSITPATATIDCGQSVGLSPTPLLSTNFNGAALGPGWSSSGTVLYTNPCGPTPSGTPAAWFGNVPLPRILTTNSFDVSCGGQVCFELDFAADDACGGCTSCEDPDLVDEGVYFQYSINAGATWVDINYFSPIPVYTAGTNPVYGWQNYCFNIPAAAWTASTRFRWSQPNASSATNDHWGIDNVSIIPSNCGYWYDWSNLPPTNDPQAQTVSPLSTTTYTVAYTNGIDLCSASITVNVNPLIADVTALNSNLNCGQCTDLNIVLLNDNSSSIVDNFNPTQNPLMWTAISAGTANTNCGSVSGNALHFDGTAARNATTIGIDATVCANITFSLFIANSGSGGAPCENADANENVVLQYSINGGLTWVLIATYNQANWDTNNSWQAQSVAIPVAAQTLNTMFRWAQPQFSACSGCDNWAIDNVNIACAPPAYTYVWTPTSNMTNATTQTPTICPLVNGTSYTGTITNSLTGCSGSDAITINVANCACQFSAFTGTVNQCQAGGTYSISGNFEYFLNPGTGTIVVEATNGSGTYTQTFSPPFVDNVLTNYLISGIPSDGTPVSVTVYFTADLACTANLNYTSPTLPTVTGISGGANYCAGALAAPILVNVTGTGPWTINYTLDGVATTATGATSPINLGSFTGVYVLQTVTDANCSNAAIGTQTIAINALPAFTAIGTNPPTCNGSDGLITLSGLDPSTNYLVGYTDDGTVLAPVILTSDAAGDLIISGLNPGSYNGINIENQATGCFAAIPDLLILVNANTPSVTALSAGGTYCASDVVADIEATVTGTGPWTIAFTLNGTPQTATGPTSPVSLGNAAGIYVVTAVTDAACSDVASGTETIVVHPLPTVTNLSGGGIYCPALPISNILVDVTGTGPWTISYTLNGVAATQSGVGSPISLGNAIGDYVVTAISDVNCTNTAAGMQTILVNGNPAVTSFTGGGTYCLGDPVADIEATVAGLAPWTLNYTLNGVPMTSSSAASTFNLGNAAGNYVITAITDGNCTYPTTANQQIVVNPLPIVSAGNDFTICTSEQAILTGSGAATYVWDNGVTNGVLFYPSTTTNYTVVGTDANGCVASDQMVLTVEPSPIVSFSADVTEGCSPLQVQFTNTTPGSILESIWNIEGANPLTGLVVDYTFDLPGLYDVTLTVTSTNGCVASETYSDYIYIEADPIASFVPSTSTISIYSSDVTFLNNSSGATNYQWDLGNGAGLVFDTEPTVTYPNEVSTNYTVTLYALSPLGCIDSMNRVIAYKDDVIFYVPNAFTPDNDDFNPTFQPVFTAGFDQYDFELLIYNRWGEVIFESHDASIGWDGTYGGELVAQGTYTWKIEFKTLYTDERISVNGHVSLLK